MHSTLHDIRQAFGLLAIRTRWRWVGLLPLAVTGAAAETMGALAVFVLLRVIADPATVDHLPLATVRRRWLPDGDPHAQVIAIAMLVVIVYFARNALLGATAWAKARIVHGSMAELSCRSYRAYLRAPFALSGSRNPAAMIQRVQRASEVVPTLVLGSVLNLATEALV